MPHEAESPVNPSPWVLRLAHLARAPVLDLACGGGRHTRLFADAGLPVTALDRDLSPLGALAAHPRVTAVAADLEAGGGVWPLAGRAFGTVVVTNYLWRPVLGDIVAAVAPGGVLLYETFAVGNEAYGRPRNPDFLLRPGELLEAVAGRLAVVAYEHGRIERPRPAVVQRICAVNGDAPAALSGPGA